MSNLASMFGVWNVAIPDEGPKCIRADYDFSSLASYDTEGLLATTTGTMSYVQGMFIDNRLNQNILTVKCNVTQQVITVPAECQGYFPVLITNPPRFTVSTTPAADLAVVIFFYNVPIQPGFWGPNGTAVSGAFLTDAELRAAPVDVTFPSGVAIDQTTPGTTNGVALKQIGSTTTATGNGVVGAGVQRVAIASDNSSIPTTPTKPIGGAYTDRSIANLTGASQTLMAANANRRILIVSNEGATTIAINLAGGTAALNTAGNITILAGGSITLDSYPPVGAITIIGTLNADVTAFEG